MVKCKCWFFILMIVKVLGEVLCRFGIKLFFLLLVLEFVLSLLVLYYCVVLFIIVYYFWLKICFEN